MIARILLCISLIIFSLGSYFIWFSKKNIFNHVLVGSCLVAYIIPMFVFDFDEYATKEVFNMYVTINTVGCVFFLAGMFIGFKWKRLVLVDSILQINFLSQINYNSKKVNHIIKLANYIFIAGIVGVVISYCIMGFIPLFSADPYQAKFFKGEYQAPYQRVAFLYRTSRQFLEFLMPLKILEIFYKRDLKNIVLVLTAIVLIALSLNRGPIAGGALTAISIVVALKKRNLPFWLFMVFTIGTYMIGSGVMYIAAFFVPDSPIAELTRGTNFFEAVAYGAPDIPDQLGFLSGFLTSGSPFNYGLTFIGGLIPFNFPYNPGVYTLRILNDTDDVSGISSGGLRLPISIWGYVSFGWLGVALVPFISAFFTGYLVRRIKSVLQNVSANMNGYMAFFLLYFMFTNVAVIFVNFYILLIYSLPGFIVYFFLVKFNKRIKLY